MNNKILVIDDDKDILDAIRFTLETEGYEVITSEKGENAYPLCKQYTPALIILDMLLSGNDGRKIARELRNKKETADTPILLTSAHPHAKMLIEDLDINDFLAKPFEIEELINKVKSIGKTDH